MGKFRQVRRPARLNKDVDKTALKPDESPNIVQVRSTKLGNEQVLTPLIGTLAIASSILTSSHKSIGAFRDDTQQTEIWFFYNIDPTKNLVVRFYPLSADPIQVLAKGAELGFTLTNKITCCSIADNFLMFSDNNKYPKYIDMDKANRTGKKINGSILFGKTDGTANYVFPFSTAGVEYYFKAYDTAGTVIADELIYTSDGTTEGDAAAGARAYAEAFNANTDVNTLFVATYCGCGEVEIEELAASGTAAGLITTFEVYLVNNTSAPVKPTTQISIYNNIYPNTLTEFHIGRARRVQAKFPTVTYGVDESNSKNLIQDIDPQFAVRYIYTDGFVSTSSPISPICLTPMNCAGTPKIAANYLDIDFTDEFSNVLAVARGGLMKQSDYLQDFRAVEILVRTSNIAPFQIAVRLERCDFGINRQWWRYYNNLQTTALPTSEQPTTKLFDAVPYRYKAEAVATNQGGKDNTRAYIANSDEDKPKVCPDLRISAQSTGNPPCSKLYNIIVDMAIQCPFVSWNGGLQAVWQYEGGDVVFGGMNSGAVGYVQNLSTDYAASNRLPSHGFVGYLANTDYIAISKQIIGDEFNGDYSDTDRGVLYGEGSGGRDNVRDAIGTGTVTQRFIFYNVKPGRYIFRLASNMCSYGDVMGVGEVYDLDKGRLFHNTSMACNLTEDAILEVIDCPYVAGVYENGTVSFTGGEIYDLTDSSALQATSVAIGYLKDAQGSNSPEVLKSGLAVEGMKFSTNLIAGGFPQPADEKYTDPNGFFFAGFPTTGYATKNEPSLLIEDYTGAPPFIKAQGDNLYLGGLQSFYNGTLGTIVQAMAQVLGLGLRASICQEFIAYTQDNIPFSNAKNIIVSVEDQNGDPLQGVPVVITKVGRVAITDSLGKAEIFKYSNDIVGAGTIGTALLAQGDGCCIDPDVAGQAAALTFAETAPLAADIPLPSTGAFPLTVYYDELFRTLKRGQQYLLGVIYLDLSNRSTTTEYTDNSIVYIPFWTQDTPNRDYFALEWRIYTLPPTWATHYQLVIGRDGGYSKYVQVVADTVTYYEVYKNTTENILSSFAAGNASQIQIGIEAINTFNNQYPNSSVGYTFTQGDRLRIIQKDTGELYDTYVDVPILGQVGSAVVIANSSDLQEIKTGYLIELYSFANGSNNEATVFNEIGDVLPIINDGGTLYHGGGQSYTLGAISITAQDQSAVNDYASGYLDWGNTYLHNRPYQTNANNQRRLWQPLVESQYISDFRQNSANISIGRPNLYTPNTKQTLFPRQIRFSNPYYPASKVNGLCGFEQLNAQNFDINIYEINHLSGSLGYLVALGQLGSLTVYLGAAQMVNQQEGFIALKNDVLGGYNFLLPKDGRMLGTCHPQSVALVGNRPVCFNVQNGTIGYYTDGGVQILSDDGMRAEFLTIANLLQAGDRVVAAYDSLYNEYTITLRDRRGNGYKSYTYSFNEGVKGWSMELRYHPNSISGTQYGLTSYVDSTGIMYKHNQGAIGTFYGNFFPAEVTVVFNDNAGQQKTHNVLSIETVYEDVTTGDVWQAPTKGDVWGNHPVSQTLMETRILKTSFERLFSRLWAYIPKDMNTPGVSNPVITGENMTCNVLNVTLSNANTKTFSTLAFVCEGTTQT